MFDRYQREIHYLRLSVTDLCNLRCRYCMPDGVEKLEREAVLTYEEFLRLAALFAIILSFCPKFAALIVAMPAATMGGVSLVLYGMISAVGVRNVVENNVDFTKSRNVLVAAMIMGLAVGVTYNGAIVIPVGGVTISLSGLAVAALVGILMNAVLPGKDYEFGTNEQGDTSVNFGTRAE